MTKQSFYRIETATPAGWYKVVSKATGACVDNVKGYHAALEIYKRRNKEARKAQPPMLTAHQLQL